MNLKEIRIYQDFKSDHPNMIVESVKTFQYIETRLVIETLEKEIHIFVSPQMRIDIVEV